MALRWYSALETGIEEIDGQHRQLFEQIDRLLESAKSGAGQDACLRILDFLGGYVVEHFATEERYMERYGYPKKAEHKQQHAELVEYYRKMRARVEAEGAKPTLIIQLQHSLVEWLNNHILKSDRDLGDFLKSKR
ncbi:hemerythrin family protein [Symbiobacterium thermophilum]|nr:hemerythrin family protein [Symbiobacterium thermophilum]